MRSRSNVYVSVLMHTAPARPHTADLDRLQSAPQGAALAGSAATHAGSAAALLLRCSCAIIRKVLQPQAISPSIPLSVKSSGWDSLHTYIRDWFTASDLCSPSLHVRFILLSLARGALCFHRWLRDSWLALCFSG